jgi:hypothetical protein
LIEEIEAGGGREGDENEKGERRVERRRRVEVAKMTMKMGRSVWHE